MNSCAQTRYTKKSYSVSAVRSAAARRSEMSTGIQQENNSKYTGRFLNPNEQIHAIVTWQDKRNALQRHEETLIPSLRRLSSTCEDAADAEVLHIILQTSTAQHSI